MPLKLSSTSRNHEAGMEVLTFKVCDANGVVKDHAKVVNVTAPEGHFNLQSLSKTPIYELTIIDTQRNVPL